MAHVITPTDFTVTDKLVRIVARVEADHIEPGRFRPMLATRLDGATFPDDKHTIIWELGSFSSDKFEFGPELYPETPDELLNLMAACLEAAAEPYFNDLINTEATK